MQRLKIIYYIFNLLGPIEPVTADLLLPKLAVMKLYMRLVMVSLALKVCKWNHTF